VPPRDLSVIGRLLSAVELREHGWERVELNALPLRGRVYSALTGPPVLIGTPQKVVLPGRIERPLPPYQGGCLQLTEGSMAESLGHDPNTLIGYALLSRQARQPYRLCSPGGRRVHSKPMPLRAAAEFEPAPAPCRFTSHVGGA
jgi:hypothetical protein